MEEVRKIAPERRQKVGKRRDGRACEVVFELRDVSLRQLATVGKLLLRQVLFEPHLFEFASEFYHAFTLLFAFLFSKNKLLPVFCKTTVKINLKFTIPKQRTWEV